jgi:hypothetical protein
MVAKRLGDSFPVAENKEIKVKKEVMKRITVCIYIN